MASTREPRHGCGKNFVRAGADDQHIGLRSGEHIVNLVKDLHGLHPWMTEETSQRFAVVNRCHSAEIGKARRSEQFVEHTTRMAKSARHGNLGMINQFH